MKHEVGFEHRFWTYFFEHFGAMVSRQARQCLWQNKDCARTDKPAQLIVNAQSVNLADNQNRASRLSQSFYDFVRKLSFCCWLITGYRAYWWQLGCCETEQRLSDRNVQVDRS